MAGHVIVGYMWLLVAILAAIDGYWWLYMAGRVIVAYMWLLAARDGSYRCYCMASHMDE